MAPTQCEQVEDLRRLDCNPARLLSGRVHTEEGRSDPLEQVLYFTSVGVPSYVYDTVKSLRSARGERLGATQRKLPELHFAVLAILSVVELLVFPVLAAGCANLDTNGVAALPGHILFFQAGLFGLMATAITLTFVILYDLWRPVGDTYNFETILQEMVSGMEEELEVRLLQSREQDIEAEVPSGPFSAKSFVDRHTGRKGLMPRWGSTSLLAGFALFSCVAVAEGRAKAPEAAVLTFESKTQSTKVGALYASWTEPVSVNGLHVVRPSDPFACTKLHRCRSCAMLVRQGHGPKRVRNQGGQLGQVNS
eukprot:symbB.v1.2.038115.t1/scaffold5830.1/size23279/2